jgi:hypothetical protein
MAGTVSLLEIGEVRLDAAPDQVCDPREVLERSGPIDVIFRLPTASPDRDALEVQLQRATYESSFPGCYLLSGQLYGRRGCDKYLSTPFKGYYFPDHQEGKLAIGLEDSDEFHPPPPIQNPRFQ